MFHANAALTALACLRLAQLVLSSAPGLGARCAGALPDQANSPNTRADEERERDRP